MPRSKVILQAIAEAASVSLSTVDRVLNERGGVSYDKRLRVIRVARELGVQRLLPPATHEQLRIDAVITQSDTDFMRRIDESLSRFAQIAGDRVVLHRTIWTERQRKRMLQFVREPGYLRNGLIIVGHDTTDVREAVGDVVTSGIPVVALVSKMAGLHGVDYVGIDNYMAGRTAAYLVHQAGCRGRILLITGPLSYAVHQDRSRGFIDYMRSLDVPGITIDGPIDVDDRKDPASRAVFHALTGDTPLVALYNTGSGSAGVCEALSALPRERHPLWVGHDTTEEHRRFAAEGYLSFVIDQDADAQALNAIQHLLYLNGEVALDPRPLQPRFHVVTPESWPATS